MAESPRNDSTCVPFSADSVDIDAYAALREACLRLGFLPAFRHGILIEAAMVSPGDEAAVSAIRQLTHQEVRRFRISERDFDRAVAAMETQFPVRTGDGALPMVSPAAAQPEHWDFARKSPREIAGEIVSFAFALGASDILLDDQEPWMDVAIKHEGRKRILPPVERASAPGLIKVFKEMAGLSTGTVAVSQSGFAAVPVGGGRRADLRVEVTPTLHGESLVARLQDRERQLARMAELPFTDAVHLRIARTCLAQRQGLVVATGPTGQGKTTTLYACLGQIDRSALNVRTLEDPVEFSVPWITQIPVGSGTGRGFGNALKSLLRQAPDVILMGEIRDRAAAQTCVEAVDTGHLILASLHTRDAVGVVPRLLDLGLTGRQISGALLLAIGQRLLRRLCPHCRRPCPPTSFQRRHFEDYRLPAPEVLYNLGGCPACGGQGERGLAPVFEFFHPAGDGDLGEAIGRASREAFDERALRALWKEKGGSPLVREGLRLAACGEVAHSELLKYEPNPPDC